MEILTDLPGLQFYSGDFLDGTVKGKDRISYQYRALLCLETLHYPGSPNKPNFPSVTIRPGEIYKQTLFISFQLSKES